MSRGDEQLRRLMDKLHEFNVSSYVHIPEIAVMGDTSSGKSSALSQIGQIGMLFRRSLRTSFAHCIDIASILAAFSCLQNSLPTTR
jgi:hypothetical protein